MNREVNIENSQRALLLMMSWKKSQMWIALVLALATAGLSVWIYIKWHAVLDIEIQIVSLFFVLVILFLLFSLADSAKSFIILLQRDHDLNELRFDVLWAVKDSLHHILHQHMPNYNGLRTGLDVGVELLKSAEQTSKRRADFAQKMQSLYPGMQLAEAVDALIRSSLEKHGQDSDNTKIERFIGEIVPFQRSTSE